MNTALKVFLSMSFSGGLLVLVLFLGKQFLKDKISRQWQYYIWLVVILRLLLPFGPEGNLLGEVYRAAGQAVTRTASLPQPQPAQRIPGEVLSPAAAPEQNRETADSPAEDLTAAHPLQDLGVLLVHCAWLIWLAAALGLLLRKVTIYQGFIRYIQAGLTPVSNMEMLDRLSAAAEQMGVKKPVELCVNPLISSPLLIGFFHPCIVLPSADIPQKDFHYIVLHELIHYQRRDMLYKWLVQATVCLHWFNPLVHLMSREITKACEFSCDEAVLVRMGCDSAQEYGRTLLDAMAAVGRYREDFGAVTLSGNKQLLKERLGAIMRFKRKSTAIRLLTGALTLCMVLGAIFVGTYPAAAASDPPSTPPVAAGSKRPAQAGTDAGSRDSASQAERYYEAGSLPLFQLAFSRLDEEAQEKWLEKIYADGDCAFFSAALRGLGTNSPLPADFAEKVYADEDVAFFSTLADCMDETELELWLDRALEDGNWAFQSMLFDRLDKDDEFDGLKDENEKKWEAAQTAEYQAAGVTWEGKNCYYRGQLVNIFLDIRPNRSFYTLDMNPAGTVNVKIIRDADNKITGAAYMTGAEVTELLEDMSDDEDWDGDSCPETAGRIWHPQVAPVDLKTAAAGETILLGEYTLSGGDRIWYDISAETGNRMKVFFAKGGQKDVVYWSVDNLRQLGELLRCAADFTVEPPAEPGTYQLYLQAPDGALGNITGSVSIGFVADAS